MTSGSYVCLITKMSLNYELWKLKTHFKSKIREFIDGNKVIETKLWCSQTDFQLWVLSFLSYKL